MGDSANDPRLPRLAVGIADDEDDVLGEPRMAGRPNRRGRRPRFIRRYHPLTRTRFARLRRSL